MSLMPGRHTAKQKRQAKHIADSERERGVDPKRAESIGWATVNKLDKGNPDEKPGSSTQTYTAPPSPNPTVQVEGRAAPVPVPKMMQAPKNRSYAPQTSYNPSRGQSIRREDNTGLPPPQNRSVAPAPKPPQVAAKAMNPKEQFRAMTEKLRRRAQGGGKRAARRAQIAAFGKGLTFEGGVTGHRADTFHGHYNITPQRDGTHVVGYSMNKPGAKKNYGTSRGDRHADLGAHPTHEAAVAAAVQHHKATHGKLLGKAEMMKSFKVMSIGDYYDVMKAEGGDPPAPSAPGAATPPPKKFPRKLKPTVKMKPISDEEAIANLRAGKFHEKSLRHQLSAIKALVTGYNKNSGGGALKAPNRGFSVDDLNRAMEAMPKPEGTKPPTTYLPGVHSPDSPLRRKKGKKPLLATKGGDSSFEEPTLKKDKTAKAETGVEDGPESVVHKAEGDASMSKTNFNDLFKSELGTAANDVLVDCPHCAEPITKSDLEKAHKGKGATTHVSGPKTAGGNLRSQNPEGGTMRGGDGKGQVSSSRGVPGAQKTDAVVGVQNGKGSKTHKSEEGDPPPMQKSMMSVRGTEFVQYVDYGDAPGSDAFIAKSIAEAQGALGQQATQPMDLNNDLSRLLV